MRVLTTAQMRAAERRTIEEIGVPSAELMENAGREVAAAVTRHFPAPDRQRVAVVCGKGNNGGDGCVAARELASPGVDVRVYLAAPASSVTGDAGRNLAMLGAAGVPVCEVATPAQWSERLPQIADSDVIVDALFGTGLSRPLSGRWAALVGDLNATGAPIVAIDLPSGLSADTAQVIGAAVEATMTVTLGAPKVPLLVPPAASLAGTLVLADIGIPNQIIEGTDGPRTEVVTPAGVRATAPPRPDDLHKGACGRVLVVAGSIGKTGAAHLAARGALRSGAGLLTVATPRACQPVVSALMPEYMTLGLDDTPDGTVAAAAVETVLAERCDVLAVGPGLGQTAAVTEFVQTLVERSSAPLVLDADGLNAFAGATGGLRGREGRDVIITPHPGEMARLTGMTVEQVQSRRIEVARDVATAQRVYVVLKGARTLVAAPDGTVLINMTGNAGMATGGTGDVLTGVVAAWRAQLADAQAACALGVWLHGAAGDLAAKVHGEAGLIATDLAERLGPAALALSAGNDDDGRSG